MTDKRSPMGYYYKFVPQQVASNRLYRRSALDQPWGQGQTDFSVQHMTADELRFIAGVIDDALALVYTPRP